jgi:putative ABC transport system permease protein
MNSSIAKSLRVAFFLARKAVLKGNIGITVLTIVMLSLVAMNLLFVPGLMNGIIESANTIMIKTYSADIIVEAEGDNPYISHTRELMDQIQRLDGVAAVAARNLISGDISYDEIHMTCSIVGIDPEMDRKVFEISKFVIEGSYLEPRDRDKIMLGVQIAGNDRTNLELYSSSLRKVHAGDKVKVTFGNGQKKQYEVKGIVETKFLQTDVQAFITDVEFQSLVPTAKGKATSIRVKLNDARNPEQIIPGISALQPGLKFKTWSEVAGIVKSMNDSFAMINQILNVINILVAGITVFIVTYVDVVNRRRQIGIQRAIGIKPHSITISYILRALFYAVIGLIGGNLLYRYVILPLEAKHPFSFPFGDAYLVVDPFVTVRVTILLLIVALVAAYIPVWRIMRKSILDSIWS